MYNRRGFFSKIGSMFERQGDTVFFGVQFAINVYGEDTLREKLHNVIESGSSIETPTEKRSYYKRIAALLREDLPFLEYGYWDFITKKGEADAEFNEWVTSLTAMMATEEEELGDNIDEMHRLSSDKSYVVVTLLFLLENTDVLSPFFEKIEEIEEEDYFSKSGFGDLTDAVPYIDFEYSYADASFIMPGSEEDGVSWEDIRGEGWEYLKPVMGI
ncbi:MAG: hypothetical protein J4G05_01815 [Chlorobi bacterium]|nr:hypothetical protein [Chlorobiota bacterium]